MTVKASSSGGNTGGDGSLSSSGYMGQWVCSDCKSFCSGWQVQSSAGGCLKPVNGEAGNVLVHISASGSCSSGSCNVTFSWDIAQGIETWIGIGYPVILQVGSQQFTLKQSEDTWGPGGSHNGSVSGSFATGVHNVSVIGNSTDPNFSVSVGSITIK